MNDPELGTESEVLQCACLEGCRGCSMVKISDPHGSLKSILSDKMEGENDLGKFNITRISNRQYIAMVINYKCQVSRIATENGCFITSASRENNDMILWTVVGVDSESIKNMVRALRDEGCYAEKIATYIPDFTPTLTIKQEKALRMAFDAGYYEIPRKNNIHDLCKRNGLSPSTFDVTLRTAEKKIVSYYLQGNKDNIVDRRH